MISRRERFFWLLALLLTILIGISIILVALALAFGTNLDEPLRDDSVLPLLDYGAGEVGLSFAPLDEGIIAEAQGDFQNLLQQRLSNQPGIIGELPLFSTPSTGDTIPPDLTATSTFTPSSSPTSTATVQISGDTLTPSVTFTASFTPDSLPQGTLSSTPLPSTVTITPSSVPSTTPSPTPSSTPSPTGTSSQTSSPTSSFTPSLTQTFSQTSSLTPSPTPSKTPSQTPSLTPSHTPSKTPSLTPSLTPTKTPTKTQTPRPPATFTPSPSVTACAPLSDMSFSAFASRQVPKAIDVSWSSFTSCTPVVGVLTARYLQETKSYASYPVQTMQGTQIDKPPQRSQGNYTIEYQILLRDSSGQTLTAKTQASITWP